MSRNLFRNEIVRPAIPPPSARNLHYARLPRAVFTYISAPMFADTLPHPACPADEVEVIVGNVNRAQRLLYHPSYHLTSPPAEHPERGAAPRGPSRARSAQPKARLSPSPADGASSVRDMERSVANRSAYRRHMEYRLGVMVAHFSHQMGTTPAWFSPISIGAETLPPLRNASRPARIAVLVLQLILLRISLNPPHVNREEVLSQHLGDFMSTNSGVPYDLSTWYDDGSSLPRRQL